jgi:NNP family nitrate/nitrite transporter-like MFS transporter
MREQSGAWRVLSLNTLAFTVCFAAWMLNGVLVTFLVENGIFDWDTAQMGTLIGIPVLTGSIMRLPLGMLTDRFGGRPVFALLMLLCAVPMYLLSQVDSYTGYLLASLGFGLAGTSFAVGIAFSSVWFSRERQGTALGIFGAGNAGAALTVMVAPGVLRSLTNGGQDLDRWRLLPQYYAVLLVVMAIVFFLFTRNKKPEIASQRTVLEMLRPLRNTRVWRFGLYYFLVFGGWAPAR